MKHLHDFEEIWHSCLQKVIDFVGGVWLYQAFFLESLPKDIN